MRIAMFTNTYLPQVGGVAESVARFTRGYRRCGHATLVVAPEYGSRAAQTARREPDAAATCHDEPGDADVVRVPALPRFKGSDFSFAVPVACDLKGALDAFKPDVVHAHHPFLLGTEAARVAAAHDVPLVFTHHTMYEWYTHYVPLEIPSMRTFIQQLATGYANLCDAVYAPSASVADILRGRGVTAPLRVVPTGVDLSRFADGDGAAFRRREGIPPRGSAVLVGHVGRLAAEKNLPFLAESVVRAMRRMPQVHAVLIGSGALAFALRKRFAQAGLGERTHFPGRRSGQDLVDAYHAMDVFVFASKTETQGMVLAEALAAGCPVVALDAPGAREVAAEPDVGRLVAEEDADAFAAAVCDLARRADGSEADAMRGRARAAAAPFDEQRCIDDALAGYEEALAAGRKRADIDRSDWAVIAGAIKREWDIWSNRVGSLGKVARQKLDREGFTGVP